MKEILQSKKGFMALVAITALTIVTVVSILSDSDFVTPTLFWGTLSSILVPYLTVQGLADASQAKNQAPKQDKP